MIEAAADEKLAAGRSLRNTRESPAKVCKEWSADAKCELPGGRKSIPTCPGSRRLRPGWSAWFSSHDRYAGAFRFHDAPRPDTKPFLHHLAPRHEVNRVMLVSGDRESEVRYLADQVGHYRGVRGTDSGAESRDRRKGNAGKRGPCSSAMESTMRLLWLAATVGVAFGPNSDITSEAADAVILTASLRKVDELIHVSHRMRSIALQSAVGGMAASLVGMIAAAAGYLPPLEGAILQEIIDFLAVGNAVRVALPVRDLADF